MKLFTRTDSSTIKNTIAIYREEARPFKKTIWMFAVLIPFSHFLYLVLLPLIVSIIVQLLIEHPYDITLALQLVGVMAIIGVTSIIIQHKAFIAFFNHEEVMTTRLTERALRGLLAHSQQFFANQKVGSLAGDVNTFSRSYLSIMDTIMLQTSNIFVSLVASLIVIGFMAPILLIPTLLLTAIILAESTIALNRRAVYRNQRKELQSKLFGTFADIIGNQTLVRMFGRSENEIATTVRERKAIEKVAEKEINAIQISAELRMAILIGFQIITMLVAVYLAANGLVSIAALIFTVTYLSRIAGVMYNINSITRNIEQAFLDASKVTEILQRTPDVLDIHGASKLTAKSGAVRFKSVSFTYIDDGNQKVFSNLSFTVPASQSIGLVGKSGGGKSTLTQLLLRYMDVQSGEITIDNQNIANVTQDSLRAAISYVPQEPYLFHRSLRENIAYGKPNATDKEIMRAAKQAYAMEFIEKLPNGLDTIVGERGVKLSGGQRQRVAIARAILKDAPILILDEATSALDSESEVYIQKALTELMKNHTSIVIAHRLSTIAKLDRIIVLDNGRIVEDGTHNDLIKKGGTYATLWNHQSGGFIED